jgi:hypothetical protein
MFKMEAEDVRVAAPMLYITRETAEAELRILREVMPDAYLRAIGEYGKPTLTRPSTSSPSCGCSR